METSRKGIFVAGDGAGIAGVLVARRHGEIAGLYAAAHAGVITTGQARKASKSPREKLVSLNKFRRAIDRLYPVFPALYGAIPDDTVICRCEGVTAGDVREAIRKGTTDLNDIKKRTRMGMGYCQGIHCTPTVAAILSLEFNVKSDDIRMMKTRPPARSVPLQLLIDLQGADAGKQSISNKRK
jgi:bacterioferritin-associated ferredoxin